MTSDPDQIREQIEQTRTSLSEDVNTLARSEEHTSELQSP